MKRQRILFLKENYILRILKNFMMAGLFIIALLLILVHKVDLGLLSGLSKGIFFITAPLIHTATLPAQGLSYGYKKSSEIIHIYQENTRLKKEAEQVYTLRNKLNAYKTENKILKKLLHHIELPEIKTYTAHVIAENGNAFTNSLIIYLGENAQNIKNGYAVVNSQGLIGRIDLVSGNYARVTLITDINSKIPVISRKSRDRGILVGQNSPELKLIFTPLLGELHKGDELVTSGIGGGIPANIPVAKITNTEVENISARPLFDTDKIEIVKILAFEVMPSSETQKDLK